MRMISKVAVAAAVSLCVGMSVSVQAADLVIEDVVVDPVIDNDWSGAYVGVHAGYGWGNGPEEGDPEYIYEIDGFFGGVQAGALAQFGMFVLGVQGDVSYGSLYGPAVDEGVPEVDDELTINWLATLTGRAGVAVDQFMVYGLAGLSAAAGNSVYRGDTADVQHVGYTVGVGAAVKVDENVSVFAEYAYHDLGVSEYDYEGVVQYEYDLNLHTVKLGLNYSF